MRRREPARALLASYIAQRRELGDAEITLERLSPAALRALLAAPGAAAAPTVAAAAEPRPAGTLVQLGTFEALREEALGCHRCGLAATRRHVVFGEGDPAAQLMVVGEAPGADEDASGRPFVGRAGRLLELMLAAVGFARQEVYICNVLKCRPPENRNPRPDEVEACSGFLRGQVEHVAPRVILACGTFAAQTLLATGESIGRLRGGAHEYRGVPVVPTYHPAALLRNRAWIRGTWDDLQRLRDRLETA